MIFIAAPCERNLSVTVISGWPYRFIDFLKNINAAFSVSALGKVAFQNFTFVVNRPPKIVRFAIDLDENSIQMPFPIWERTQFRDRFFLVSVANIDPNLFHQNLRVSWLISIPRLWSKSSTLRSHKKNGQESITANRIISGDVKKSRNGDRLFMARP